ncbi:hypothetical protein ACLB1O_16155 [Escherichia coli]
MGSVYNVPNYVMVLAAFLIGLFYL